MLKIKKVNFKILIFDEQFIFSIFLFCPGFSQGLFKLKTPSACSSLVRSNKIEDYIVLFE